MDSGKPSLGSFLLTLRNDPSEVARKTRTIYETLLRTSGHVRTGNFSRVADTDVARLFELYDSEFFAGRLRDTLQSKGQPIRFRLAPRMTSAGGKTFRWRKVAVHQGRRQTSLEYEIAISSILLYQSFRDVQRPVVINGLLCADRLEAMQRIMEHELIHLGEFLAWNDSNCSGPLFKRLVQAIFAHNGVTHNLVTQHERAVKRFNLRVGDVVRFVHEDQQFTGRINRITRRATVLVEHPQGDLYTDGKRYAKFYVPLAVLQKVS